MKKAIIAAAFALASLAGFCSAGTNEEWYVVHRADMRYCMLIPTNMPDRAGLVVQRLGNTNTGAPKYAPAELVRLFGGEEIDMDFADKVDGTFIFWWADTSKGMFVLRERKFKDIWRKVSAGEAD